MNKQYTLAEAPAAVLLGRRGFLKVVGVCVAAFAICGFAISDLIASRNKVIKARQNGLYNDDKRCQKLGLTSCHQNATIPQAYKDMGMEGQYCAGTMYTLVHTSYYARANLALGEGNNGH